MIDNLELKVTTTPSEHSPVSPHQSIFFFLLKRESKRTKIKGTPKVTKKKTHKYIDEKGEHSLVYNFHKNSSLP